MMGIRKMLKRNGPGKRLVVMVTCFALVFAAFVPPIAAAIKDRTEMQHTQPGYFVPEHRMQLDAKVSDPTGVDLVRCYFKAAGEADFVFVPMTHTGGDDYSGILPAASPATEQIEYLFLAVNNENEIVKSESFYIDREIADEPPPWQEIGKEEEIRVSMELDQVPSEVPGFSDSIVMDQVESGLRFGVVAGGLYLLTSGKSAGTSGAAASATSAGTVTAGAAGAGLSTAAIVGIGVAGAVATAGGVAVASDSLSSSSSSGSSSGSSSPSDPQSPQTWNSWHQPTSPSAGEDVTVYAQVNSPGVDVRYTWSGTDGASGSGTRTSDSSGRISFTIPGASSGVTDTVTISVPDWGPSYTKTWTYTFVS